MTTPEDRVVWESDEEALYRATRGQGATETDAQAEIGTTDAGEDQGVREARWASPLWLAVRSIYDRHDDQRPLNHVNVVEWVEAVEPVLAAEVAAATSEAQAEAVHQMSADMDANWRKAKAAEAKADDFEGRYEVSHDSRMHAERALAATEAKVQAVEALLVKAQNREPATDAETGEPFRNWVLTAELAEALASVGRTEPAPEAGEVERLAARVVDVEREWSGMLVSKERAEAELRALREGIERVEGLAKSRAITARARGHNETERDWLDVLAITERALLAPSPAATTGEAGVLALEAAAQEAWERGDIGKVDGVEAWVWLRARAAQLIPAPVSSGSADAATTGEALDERENLALAWDRGYTAGRQDGIIRAGLDDKARNPYPAPVSSGSADAATTGEADGPNAFAVRFGAGVGEPVRCDQCGALPGECTNQDTGEWWGSCYKPGQVPCPTCSGPTRETVGMVCQTCGTDYAPAPVSSGEAGTGEACSTCGGPMGSPGCSKSPGRAGGFHTFSGGVGKAAPVVAPSAEPVHWISDAPTSLHGNGAAAFANTTYQWESVTCTLCLSLRERSEDWPDSVAPSEGDAP